MMRSMFSGVSGLRSHQTKMDVIGNNIANVNTVGYKASRVTFKEVFTQTISGASGANTATGRGGVNPQQIGLGVNVGSIDNIMTQGAAQRTDVTTDLMIQGDSFFVVTDTSGTYFTRNGAMYTDEEGNLALTGTNGLLVNGWYAKPNAATGEYGIVKGAVEPIQISGSYEYIEPTITTMINYGGNLNGNENDGVKDTTITFHDSLGNKYSMDVRFEMVQRYDDTGNLVLPNTADTTAWKVSVSNKMYLNGDTTTEPITFDFDKLTGGVLKTKSLTATPPATSADGMFDVGYISFGKDGKVPATTPTVTGYDMIKSFNLFLDTSTMSGPMSPISELGNDQNGGIAIDFKNMTQFDKTSDATSRMIDGSAAGSLNRFSIGPDGIITGSYSNGLTRPIAQVAVASFVNPAGLEKIGNNLYSATANSGEFKSTEAYAIQELGGSFIIGSLEMSNVDLSSEFTEMITTQRGFQANSRIITTSDELLQELVNLKR